MIVQPLRLSDLEESSRLHEEVLKAEFLARCGRHFLRQYHRAWIESPYGISVAAIDDQDRLVGVLLGSTEPKQHYRVMLRRHGLQLGLFLLAKAIRDPIFGRELLATRAVRYARGVTRVALSVLGEAVRTFQRQVGVSNTAKEDLQASHRRSGEITHVMVKEDMAGRGIGRLLLEAARTAAERARINELVVVAMPELPSASFYEHLGWRRVGVKRSRSGESFIEFRLEVHPDQ
jgi:GNAT superfamily N-acetyltransferase